MVFQAFSHYNISSEKSMKQARERKTHHGNSLKGKNKASELNIFLLQEHRSEKQ